MNPAPLPIEFIQGLPPAIAPTMEQVREMFPAMKAIQLSEICVKELDRCHMIAELVKARHDVSSDMKEMVVTKFGERIDQVLTNPNLATSSKEEFRAVMDIKRIMSSNMIERMMALDMLLKMMHNIKFSEMCADMMRRYPDMRFDVNDYIEFIYKKRTNEVMIYGYTMPGYRFASARSTVYYDTNLQVVDSLGDSVEHDLATKWVNE